MAHAQDRTQPIRDITKISIDEQALRSAVTSRTLTWLTGTPANNDHISVGRVANFFGFVGMRVASGHSLTRSAVARDALIVLDDTQRAVLFSLLEADDDALQQTALARIEMNRALEGLLNNQTITQEAFLELGRAYGESEAELGRVIGQAFGDIAQTLTPSQQEAFLAIRAAHVSGQADQITPLRMQTGLSRDERQDLANLASRLLSWTTGTTEYNDFLVVGKPSQHFGFVSLRSTSTHGISRGEVAKDVWNILTTEQQNMLDAAVAHNLEAFDDLRIVRSQLMRALEAALDGDVIPASEVRRLGAEMGMIEARMTWAQANAILQVRDHMSEAQFAQLSALRPS
ncbi:hypothetical protein SLH49_12620 [Cognatiyoonia sp. IB215446]|uniref:hypothetical protein n=1 Tax=Cognatiyoonia sp. IB215446 TaxID=3097355 RepID=UPI002A149651|nr:hypothetical protein [Cognatiyoonia sp. IB215446]MDX8348824.1 hypothetical protein [Cognatiyoonia sp. IB215446]